MLSVTSYSDSAGTQVPVTRTKVGGWFSPSLLCKNLNRFWPLWAAYGAAWLLMWPGFQFVTAFGRSSWYVDQPGMLAGELADQVMAFSMEAGLFMAVIFGVVFAMALFSYSTTPRSVGMFHSFPIRREGLFLTNYLTGIVVFVSVLGVSILLTGLVQLAAGAFNAEALGLAFLSAAGKMLFFYSFAVFCAAFTGHILAIPAFYFILNCITYALCSLVQFFAETVFFGYRSTSPGWAEWMTPIYAFLEKMGVSGGYIGNDMIWVEPEMYGLSVLGIYTVAALVLAAVALAVYCRRPSEAAGDVVAVWWAKPLFRYGVAASAGLSLGQGLYYLLWEAFMDTRSRVNFPVLLLCIVLLGLVGLFAAEMLMSKSFRVLRRSWKGAVGLAAGLVLLGLSINLDFFGVENRVPQADQVEYVNFSIGGRAYIDANFDQAEDIQLLTDLQTAILADKTTFIRREDEQRWDSDGVDYFIDVSLNYQLKNGSYMSRRYELWYPMEEITQAGSAIHLLAQTASSPPVQRVNLEIPNLNRFVGGELSHPEPIPSGGYTSDYTSITAEQAQALYAAIRRDIDAGHFGINQLNSPLWEQETYNNSLDLYYLTEQDIASDAANANRYDYRRAESAAGYNIQSLQFSVHCTELIAALKEFGLVSEERPLVTNDEVYSYGQQAKYDETYSFETFATNHTAEIALPQTTSDQVYTTGA